MGIKGYIVGLCSCLLLWACQKEEVENPFGSVKPGEVQLSFSTEGLLRRHVVATKGDVKTAEEQEIHSLHVFIFDKEGEYLQPSEGARYQGYRHLTGGKNVMNIDCEGWADKAKAKEATIVVVANVEDGTFQGATATTPPTNVSNLAALANGKYLPNTGRALTALPASGMPMYCRLDGQDLTSGHTSNSITVPLQALMARVDVSIQVNSDHTDVETGTLPSLMLTKCEVLNAPAGVNYTEDGSKDTDLSEDGVQKIEDPDECSWYPPVKTIHNRDGVQEFTFYVFENLQDSVNYDYPEGVITEDSLNLQKYKPERAQEDALAFRFTGNYVTYNGASYEATYTLYLGANHTDDFNVRRNRQYKNNITIKGLMNVNDSPSQVTFDARVDVEETNPYFISILKDRKLDCHFNVVPMDVYFMTAPGVSGEQSIDVEILGADWVRLEKVVAEDMQNGTVTESGFNTNTHLAAQSFALNHKEWCAGNGKRKYFTTDLVTNTLRDSTSANMKHRDRIYFYVDECLDIWHLGTAEERTRTATVKITYKEGETVIATRKLVLEQSKLLEVTFHDASEGGEQYDMTGKTIYIEAYEEYLNYSDPLEEYNSDLVYDGLPWEEYDREGTVIDNLGGLWGIGGTECSSNFFWGYDFTKKIVEEIEMREVQVGGGWFPQYEDSYAHLDLNTKPESAAGYCFIKNKRDSKGNVPNPKWYLPGIRELERILEDYYIDYPEFREHFYWSSAAGEGNYIPFENVYQNRNYARATKAYIKDDGSGFDYYKSGTSYEYTGENGTGGFAPRKTILRIRAARIDNLPQ